MSTMRPRTRLRVLAFLATLAPHVTFGQLAGDASGLSTSLSTLVVETLAKNSSDSWVSGTRAQALLELDYPEVGVFTSQVPTYGDTLAVVPTSTNGIIDEWYSQRTSGCPQLICDADGATGDQASVGVAWILASMSEPTRNATYTSIIQQELNFLTITSHRAPTGAISTRPANETVQIWADFVYMAPPFIAYAGAVYSNATLLQVAYDQCRLYRQYLLDPTSGLWHHIVLGDWQDLTLWGTGNAWAAAGMLRVYATMRQSKYANQFRSQMSDLASWTNEIIDNAFPFIRPDGLLPNQYDLPVIAANTTFSDAASSALLAATVFRLSYLSELANTTHVQTAELLRTTVNSKINTATGWLSEVVDPLSWTEQITQSPEAEAFVLLLQAAYADYSNGTATSTSTASAATSTKSSGAGSRMGSSRWSALVLLCIMSSFALL